MRQPDRVGAPTDRMRREVDEIAAESTCLKRVTVCILYDANGVRLSAESNRCSPPGGICTRRARSDERTAYPSESGCNWHHAERRALAALPPSSAPHSALLYGHGFPCPACEAALMAAGVAPERITVITSGYGTGLRVGAPTPSPEGATDAKA